MLNYIWSFMLIGGFICGFFNGKLQNLTNSILIGSKNSLNLCLSLIGVISLWSGVMNIADKCGILNFLSKLLNPIISLLFPKIPKNHIAKKSIIMNLIANFLGLGNAATPFGIKAMKHLQEINQNKNTLSKSMSMFLILNGVCLQIVPTTIISIRASLGSTNPADIIYVIWIVSFITIFFTIIVTKIFEKLWR